MRSGRSTESSSFNFKTIIYNHQLFSENWAIFSVWSQLLALNSSYTISGGLEKVDFDLVRFRPWWCHKIAGTLWLSFISMPSLMLDLTIGKQSYQNRVIWDVEVAVHFFSPIIILKYRNAKKIVCTELHLN